MYPHSGGFYLLLFIIIYSLLSMDFSCIICELDISNSDIAIDCDECHRWNHLSCGTGISLLEYREMMNGNLNLGWKCRNCNIINSRPSSFFGEINQVGDINENNHEPSIQPVNNIDIDEVTLIEGGNQNNGVSINLKYLFILYLFHTNEFMSYFMYIYSELIYYYFYIHQDMLTDKYGYSYTIKKDSRRTAINWMCSKRCKPSFCKAAYKYIDGNYIRNNIDHICVMQNSK